MARRLEVEIVGDARSLNRALGSAERSTTGLANKTKHLGGVALGVAGAAGIGALVGTIHTGIKEYTESAKVTAQTNAVIKSTGGAANVTAKHVQELGDSLLRKTGIDDENIRSGANLLLTFTNIRNEAGKNKDIFDQTVKVATDMSVALGRDLPSTARILGKALNDPISQLGALGRVGVTFTKEQKEMIKGWVEHGQIVKAQTFILDKLNTRFKGSAEAVGKTLPGQINIAKETFKNFAGGLVAKTIPVLEQTIMWLRDHWPEINAAIQNFWGNVKPIFVNLAGLLDAVVTVIRDHWSTIGPIVKSVGQVIQNVAKIIAAALKLVTALLRGDWSEAWKQAKAIVVAQIQLAVAYIRSQVQVMVAIGRGIGAALKAAVVQGLGGLGSAAWNQINNIGAVIAEKAGAIVGWGINVAQHLASGIISGLAGLGGKIVAIIKGAVNALIDRINSFLTFHVSIDTHIPGVGKKSFGYTSNIPHLATGTRNFMGGAALVGEKGPELVTLPRGASVTPNSALGGGPIYLVTPDGKALAEFIFDGMRGQAQIYKQRTGRTAFA